jgi:hypothetical protein
VHIPCHAAILLSSSVHAADRGVGRVARPISGGKDCRVYVTVPAHVPHAFRERTRGAAYHEYAGYPFHSGATLARGGTGAICRQCRTEGQPQVSEPGCDPTCLVPSDLR